MARSGSWKLLLCAALLCLADTVRGQTATMTTMAAPMMEGGAMAATTMAPMAETTAATTEAMAMAAGMMARARCAAAPRRAIS
jgi:hypothetical protein